MFTDSEGNLGRKSSRSNGRHFPKELLDRYDVRRQEGVEDGGHCKVNIFEDF